MTEPVEEIEEIIPDADVISRCITEYEGKEINDAWARESFIEFSSKHNYADSAIWRRYAQTDSAVHDIGVIIATAKNERRNETPGKKHLGFVSTEALYIRAIVHSEFRLDVVHYPPEGVHHAHIYCVVPPKSKPSVAVRYELKMVLWKEMKKRMVLAS